MCGQGCVRLLQAPGKAIIDRGGGTFVSQSLCGRNWPSNGPRSRALGISDDCAPHQRLPSPWEQAGLCGLCGNVPASCRRDELLCGGASRRAARRRGAESQPDSATPALGGWSAVERNCGARRLLLNAGFCGVEVQAPVLDVLVDLLGCLQKGVFNILATASNSNPARAGHGQF